MNLSRRHALKVGSSALALGALSTGISTPTWAGTSEAEAAVKAFTGGAEVGSGKISLTAPEIAENGNTVPIGVDVESAMTEADHVAAVLILAAGNPNPGVATFKFTPQNGEASASTRIRLAKTQDVIAVAKMSDGSFYRDQKTVKVTIGGCGG